MANPGTLHLGDAVVRILGDDSELYKSLDNLQSGMTQAFGQMKDLGKNLTKTVTAPIIAGFGASVYAASNFDAAMRNVNAIAQLSEDQFQALKSDVLDFSYTTRASATDVANALYNITSAGFQADEAFTLMTASSRAAGAGLATTADTSKLLITALRSYGYAAEDASYLTDVFLQTVNQGILTLPELASTLGTVLPVASSAGVSLEETAGAVAALTQAGLDASSSTIYLRQMITRLIDPSDELKEVLAELGYESGQAALEQVGLLGLLQQLSVVVGEDADALVPLFGNIRAATAAMSLMRNEAAVYAGVMENMGAVEGAVNRAREEQYESLQSQLARLKGALEGVLITLGDLFLPTLTELAKDLVPVLRSFRDIPEPVLKAGVAIAGLAAAIGPLLIVIGQLGLAFQAMPTLIAATNLAITALTANIGTLAAVGGPITLLIVALGALAAKGIQAQQEFIKLREEIIETADSAEEAARQVGELFPELEEAAGGAKTLAADAREAARAEAMAAAETEWYRRRLGDWNAEATKTDELHHRLHKSGEFAAEAIADIGESAEETAAEAAKAFAQLQNAMAGNVLDVRESIQAYQELRDKTILFTADTVGMEEDAADDIEKMRANLNEKLVDLEHKKEEKLAWVRAGFHARTAEENAEAIAYWENHYAQEADKLRGAVDEKIQLREKERDESIAAAQAQAAERTRLAEAERQAELEAMRKAQEERLLLFGLEMLEQRGLLKIPLAGWEDMEISAQEYFNLVQSGVLPLSASIKANLGGALEAINSNWNTMGRTSTDNMAALQSLLDLASGDVMNLGAAVGMAADDIAVDFASFEPILAASETRLGRLEGAFGTLPEGSKEAADEIAGNLAYIAEEAQVGAEELNTVAMTSMAETTAAWDGMWEGMVTTVDNQGQHILAAVNQLIRDMKQKFRDANWTGIGHEIVGAIKSGVLAKAEELAEAAAQAAIAALNAAQKAINNWSGEVPPEGEGATPGFQTGLSFVPYDMTARIHRAEAILSPPEAELWRASQEDGTLHKAGEEEEARTIIFQGPVSISPEALLHEDFNTLMERAWRSY